MSEYRSRMELVCERLQAKGYVRAKDCAKFINREIGYSEVCEALEEAVREMKECAFDTAGTPNALEFTEKANRWEATLSLARGKSQ